MKVQLADYYWELVLTKCTAGAIRPICDINAQYTISYMAMSFMREILFCLALIVSITAAKNLEENLFI